MKLKTERLESALESLETLTDNYRDAMANFGDLEMQVKRECLEYLGNHEGCTYGAEKLEMVACSNSKDLRNTYAELTKLRADRKILEQAIDSFKHSISGLQSLIRFESPV